MSNRILSLAAFTAWLKTKHERTKVGNSCETDSCPLAKFLTQTTGIPYEVDGAMAVPATGFVLEPDDDHSKAIKLPQWARDFINQVDESQGESISAMKALKIVESKSLGRAARRIV